MTATLAKFPFSNGTGGYNHDQRLCTIFSVYKDPGYGWNTTNGKGASKADLAANLAGMKFWEMLEQQGANVTFNICDYVKPEWDERKNPNHDVEGLPECPP